MLNPGPDHPIAVEAPKNRWRAFFAGHVIADTDDALVLREADLAPVVYFPRGDVSMEYFTRTDHVTHCPYKGDAAHYSLYMDGELVEKAAWTYEDPYPAVGEISGRIAFYPQVEVYSVDDAEVNPHHHDELQAEHETVDDVILHTDSGSGFSQREHWKPNTDGPGSEDGGLR